MQIYDYLLFNNGCSWDNDLCTMYLLKAMTTAMIDMSRNSDSPASTGSVESKREMIESANGNDSQTQSDRQSSLDSSQTHTQTLTDSSMTSVANSPNVQNNIVNGNVDFDVPRSISSPRDETPMITSPVKVQATDPMDSSSPYTQNSKSIENISEPQSKPSPVRAPSPIQPPGLDPPVTTISKVPQNLQFYGQTSKPESLASFRQMTMAPANTGQSIPTIYNRSAQAIRSTPHMQPPQGHSIPVINRSGDNHFQRGVAAHQPQYINTIHNQRSSSQQHIPTILSQQSSFNQYLANNSQYRVLPNHVVQQHHSANNLVIQTIPSTYSFKNGPLHDRLSSDVCGQFFEFILIR